MTDLDAAIVEANVELEHLATRKAEAGRAMVKAVGVMMHYRHVRSRGRPDLCSFERAESARQVYNMAARDFDRLSQHVINIRAALRGNAAGEVVPVPKIRSV